MPIKPENRLRYPPDWPAISRRIRFERARGRCECRGECGSPKHARSPNDPRCQAEHGHPHPVTLSIVVLTTAHLNHIPEDCSESNLAAFCQLCHLTYDRKDRT